MMALSIIIPTYCREQLLVDTVERLLTQVRAGDEILIVDQTPRHERETEERLGNWADTATIRWVRKRRPGQAAAMNLGARLAVNDALIFLDDDVIPAPGFLDAYRRAFAERPGTPAFCGQVLQPWHEHATDFVRDFALGFDPAYSRTADVLCLMEGNCAIRREAYLGVGGMDENFSGCTYRHGTELAYRLEKSTGRRPRFVPQAQLRHLYATGGQRAHGLKDTWGHLGASVGDYYFALTSLPLGSGLLHSLRRWQRATVHRRSVIRPWLMPSLAVREMVAWGKAVWRWWHGPRYVRPLAQYSDWTPWHEVREPEHVVKELA